LDTFLPGLPVGLFESGDDVQAAEAFIQHQPEWPRMDVELPGVAGLEAARPIQFHLPDARIILLTLHDSPGLPGRVISSLAQTSDGYLWCAGPDGLWRFDGRRFRVFYPDEFPVLKGLHFNETRTDASGRLCPRHGIIGRWLQLKP
jgi:hypothetical protein